jgi:prepilin-type N-terminal cleavage/methylation domain-containing protein
VSLFPVKKTAGFSLVELMVVVGIIGILAAIAVPKLQMFSAKAKRVEAQTTLKNIHALQTGYYTENSQFGTATQIGYVYAGKLYLFEVNAMDNTSFSTYNAVAELKDGIKLCPGQTQTGLGKLDYWYVGECPESITQCAGIINLVRPTNPNFSLNGVPQPAVSNLLSSCN